MARNQSTAVKIKCINKYNVISLNSNFNHLPSENSGDLTFFYFNDSRLV